MYRFYCPCPKISKNMITVDRLDEIHHIKDVLRLKAEDWVSVFDGRGNEYSGPIRELSYQAISVEIKEKRVSADSDINITVACAVPKKQKMDDIVDKLTQLGVGRIIPLKTRNTVVILDETKEKIRLMHWEKIAINAAKQSKRTMLPLIDSLREIKDVLSQAGDFDLKIIPTLSENARLLKDVLGDKRYKNILTIIGPEGDFTPDEVNLAKKAGCIPVSLGNLVLRVETAAVAVAGFLRFTLSGAGAPSK